MKTTILWLVVGVMLVPFVRAVAVPFKDPVSHETATRQARPRAPGEKFDRQESDPRLRKVFVQADEQAERDVANVPRDKHFILHFWIVKKKILRKKYGIDWQSPAELNPTIVYESYGQPRLTEREIREIRRVVQKQILSTTERIESFERTFEGEVYVWTRVGTEERRQFVVRKENGSWKVVDRSRWQR